MINGVVINIMPFCQHFGVNLFQDGVGKVLEEKKEEYKNPLKVVTSERKEICLRYV